MKKYFMLFAISIIFCCMKKEGSKKTKKKVKFAEDYDKPKDEIETNKKFTSLLKDTSKFNWERVYKYYFDNSKPSIEDFKVFKSKVFSPAFKIMQILNILFQILEINKKIIINSGLKDNTFEKLMHSVISYDKDVEFSFSILLKFLDIYLPDEYLGPKLTNLTFMTIFEKICIIFDKKMAENSKDQFYNKRFNKNFEFLFCIKYKLISEQSNIKIEILSEYGDKQIFDFDDRLLKIRKEKLHPDSSFSEKIAINNIECKIISYPDFIFVNSSLNKAIIEETFIMKDFNNSYLTTLYKVTFYEKKYKVIGFLYFDDIKNNFNMFNFSKKKTSDWKEKFDNSSLKYLGQNNIFEQIETDINSRIIVILMLDD